MPEPHDAEPIVLDGETIGQGLAIYREHIETSNEIAASTDIYTRCARTDIIECKLSYVLLHTIEETARHAGHADTIRQTLDVARGT